LISVKSLWRVFCLVSAGLAFGCGHRASTPEKGARTFDVRGVVVSVPAEGKTIVIKHEAIPHYMAGMTMPFEVADTNELRGLQPGDTISFRLVVTPKEGWIERLAKLNSEPQRPPPEMIHFSPAVAALDEGDALPSFRFTNELGRAVELNQFHGQTLAFTFFFTSCPFPNFCPRLTSNFGETAAKLRASPAAPARWHLFSISFDTSRDTPGPLRAYAAAHQCDPAQWSFLTGDPDTISQFADLFDERFWKEGQTIGHNLRTVVVDAAGRVRKIFSGNAWTSDDLTAEMIRAGAAAQAPR
jgi:protein SCO1/2